ncbi:hypothetical protein D9M68_884080 [compost metagenome]
MKKEENAFERNLKRSLTKTRGQIYKELPRKQKIAYLVFVISVFGFIAVFLFRDLFG